MYSRQGELDHFEAMKNITISVNVISRFSQAFMVILSPPPLQKKEIDKKIFSHKRKVLKKLFEH